MSGDDNAAPAFRDVDADERDGAAALIEMMDATDAWPAVRAGRAWVLDRAEVRAGTRVLDVGCGPGAFGRLAAARGATVVDLDRSSAMLTEARRRDPEAAVVRGDVAALPVATASFDLVHVERVLQWVDDPATALAELGRTVRSGGHLAVTDTVWSTLTALGGAAAAWVPHPTFVETLADRLVGAGWLDVDVAPHEVVVRGWDLDDPTQREGPPGLPFRRMAAAVTDPQLRRATDAAIERLEADAARLDVRLTLVSVVGRRP